MNKFIVLLLGLCLGCLPQTEEVTSSSISSVNTKAEKASPIAKPIEKPQTIFKSKIEEAEEYIHENKLNKDFCVFVDMSLPSGLNRLFVYDLKKESILLQGLCSHGCCEKPWGATSTKENPVFSNVEGSHCSSLGKYSIGGRDASSWGIKIKYWLDGLEESNQAARERLIVLHSWEAIPDEEPWPEGTAEGWGCPAVSNQVMKQLDEILKKTSKATLFWVFNE